MNRNNSWIQTYTGKKFFPLDPDPDLICIEDIAHALANLCRYGGHSKMFYSVAQHSLIVSRMSTNYPLHGLLHDASEAYLGDMVRPLKHLPEMAPYREAEDRLQSMIFERFGLDRFMPEEVYRNDKVALANEIATFEIMAPAHPDHETIPGTAFNWSPSPFLPALGKLAFLNRFNFLTDNKYATGDLTE